MDMSLNKLQELVTDREAWHAAATGVTKSWDTTKQWTELKNGVPSWERKMELEESGSLISDYTTINRSSIFLDPLPRGGAHQYCH